MTTTPVTSSKPFRVGTTGWTVTDLLDPEIYAQWVDGRFEIVEGVLTVMPGAYLFANRRVRRLVQQVEAFLGSGRAHGEFAFEIDVAVSEDRVVRVDAAFVTPADDRRQAEELARRPVFRGQMAPLFVPPTLVIESLGRGHERHDRVTKRRWYAGIRVPSYWLFSVEEQSLECLTLDGPDYCIDQSGRGDAEVRPSMFPGLVLSLADLWRD